MLFVLASKDQLILAVVVQVAAKAIFVQRWSWITMIWYSFYRFASIPDYYLFWRYKTSLSTSDERAVVQVAAKPYLCQSERGTFIWYLRSHFYHLMDAFILQDIKFISSNTFIMSPTWMTTHFGCGKIWFSQCPECWYRAQIGFHEIWPITEQHSGSANQWQPGFSNISFLKQFTPKKMEAEVLILPNLNF